MRVAAVKKTTSIFTVVQDELIRRVSAPVVEQIIARSLTLIAFGVTLDEVSSVTVAGFGLKIIVPTAKLHPASPTGDIEIRHAGDGTSVVSIKMELAARGARTEIVSSTQVPRTGSTLVAALRRAHAMLKKDKNGQPLIAVAPKSLYERRLLKLAFLAPDIQQAILTGSLPRHINLERLIKMELPNDWAEQRQLFRLPI